MFGQLTKELNFFKGHPLSMRVLLLTNLIYGMVAQFRRHQSCRHFSIGSLHRHPINIHD